MRKLFLLILLTVLIPALAQSAERSGWRRIGPPAGEIVRIVPDRRDSNLWFAINQGVLYRSENGAQSWASVSTPAARAVSVSIHPLTSHILSFFFEGSNSQYTLRISRDHGKSFQSLGVWDTAVARIVPHPYEPETWYSFGYSGKLLRSVDDGLQWTQLPLPFDQYDLEGADVVDLVVSPFEHRTLYTNIDFGENWSFTDAVSHLKSTDNGNTWKVLRSEYSWGTQYFPDPLFPDRIMAIHRLFSHTAEIQELTQDGWQTKPRTVGFDQLSGLPGMKDVLLAVVTGNYSGASAVWRSEDRGESWKTINLPSFIFPVSSVAGVNSHTAKYLVGSHYGGLFSCDSRNRCTAASKGFEESNVFKIASTKNPAVIYASTWTCLYRSYNSGKNWSDLSPKLPIRSIFTLSVNPNNARNLLVAGRRRYSYAIATSTDSGNTWKLSKSPVSKECRAVAFSPFDNQRILLGCGSSLLESTDGGTTFMILPLHVPNFLFTYDASTIHMAQDGLIYVVGKVNHKGILLESLDGGNTFSRIFHPASIVDLVPLGNSTSFLMSTENQRLFRTTDRGKTWEKLSNVPCIDKLYSADETGHLLYAVGCSNLYESKDGGRHWKDLTNEFGLDIEVRAITDPKIRPFSTATNKGVYQELLFQQ